MWDRTPKVVLSRTTLLPATPAVGSIYIVSTTAGAHVNEIAHYYDADWHYLAPGAGWTAYVVDDAENIQFNGTSWIAVGGAVHTIQFIVDGGGAAITTGIKGDLQIPYDCTVEAWTLLADLPGSIVIDVWKNTYAFFPPTAGGSITASAKPTLSGIVNATSTTLTGWTTAIAAGEVLRYNVDSASTITRVTLGLKVRMT